MTVFYFSATGNSLYVAKTIGGKLYSIPQLLKDKQFNFEDDIVGFIFPIYSLGLPKIVQKFLENIKLKSTYTFAVGTYGNMHGPCMYNLSKDFIKKGWRLNYADAILMVDNYLPIFEMSNQLNTVENKHIDKHLKEIVDNIKNKKNSIPAITIMERIFTALVHSLLSKPLDGKSAQKYIINENCNKCGTCSKVCPTGNIEIEDKIIFGNVCESCYGCVHLCPQNAIHLRNEKSNIRFRNENITLQEIIQSNSQR
ncbi:MAG: EFR1 family ferrodoxin [Spirochaetaceae bacterium]|nr:EFR1 family ferrodoxin [Spirochaetaceae bacterium]